MIMFAAPLSLTC